MVNGGMIFLLLCVKCVLIYAQSPDLREARPIVVETGDAEKQLKLSMICGVCNGKTCENVTQVTLDESDEDYLDFSLDICLSTKEGEFDELKETDINLEVETNIFTVESIDINEPVEHLVKQWSPLIWMSPEEKYMPLSAEEFLEKIYIADENGKIIQAATERTIFSKYNSKVLYLVTRQPIEILKKDNTSFLYGKSPKLYSIPVYAIVTHCSPYKSFHSSNKISIRNDIKSIYEKSENNFYFHVSYWVFYPYNEGKEVCFLGRVPTPRIFNTCFGHLKTMGNHVGDWEHMSLSFAGKSVPDKLYLAVHDAGVYYDYDERRRYFKYISKEKRKGVVQVPKFPNIVRSQGGHPVLFSAYGSHGLWAAPGEHDFIRVPKLTDVNGYGIPWKTWTNIEIYHVGKSLLPEWMRFKGKWGNPKSNCLLFKKLGICEFSDGPLGILRNKVDFYCSLKR